MVASPEERCIQAIPLEPGVQVMRCSKIPLRLVVEACYRSDIADKVEGDLVEGKDCHKGNPDVSEEVLDVDVFKISRSGS